MSQQPIVPIVIASNPFYNPRSSRDSAERLHCECSVVGDFCSASVLVLGWSVHPDFRLSVCSAALGFTQHALPPTTIKDMDAINNAAQARNPAYVSMQAMGYLAAGSQRVQ